MINTYSAQHGLDANKVARIAKCESTFNPNATNGIYQGLFQHHSGYWPARATKYGAPGASIFDAAAQVKVTTAMMAEVGYGPWECQ
ncbi:Transglycosylase-like domain protein [compost metagenome]